MNLIKPFLDILPLRITKKMKFLPHKWYLEYSYEHFTGKKLNFENPIEFNEKIQWINLYYKPKILNQLVDKYAVRSFVEAEIGSQYLNECYGVYNKANEIDIDSLPNKFVIKATHASGYNVLVKDKSELNWKKTKNKLNRWLRTSQYYRTGLEWAYKDVKPRLVVEKFLEESGRDVVSDYKFYCFNGEPKFLQVDLDRGIHNYRSFYDLDWTKLKFSVLKSKTEMIEEDIEAPSNFKEMIELSKKLSNDLPYVRVDFYSVNGKSIFGELTFYPSSGRKQFYPEKYNKILGDYIKLPKIPDGQSEIN